MKGKIMEFDVFQKTAELRLSGRNPCKDTFFFEKAIFWAKNVWIFTKGQP
jgi:hypothetical protein